MTASDPVDSGAALKPPSRWDKKPRTRSQGGHPVHAERPHVPAKLTPGDQEHSLPTRNQLERTHPAA